MFSNEAFARTAERYMDTIYRVAYGWLKNPDDAGCTDRAVQDRKGV